MGGERQHVRREGPGQEVRAEMQIVIRRQKSLLPIDEKQGGRRKRTRTGGRQLSGFESILNIKIELAINIEYCSKRVFYQIELFVLLDLIGSADTKFVALKKKTVVIMFSRVLKEPHYFTFQFSVPVRPPDRHRGVPPLFVLSVRPAPGQRRPILPAKRRNCKLQRRNRRRPRAIREARYISFGKLHVLNNLSFDFSAFREGVPILHLIVTPFPSVWHKMSDTVQNLDGKVVADITK